MDAYAHAEDLAVYSFDDLGTAGDGDLAGLLDEGDADLDALTFGIDDGGELGGQGSVGRDFDFSGSTSAFLGTSGAQQAGLKPVSGGWLDPSSASSAAGLSATTPSGRSLSPWTSLDDDPLLSRGSGAALPPAVPVVQPAAPQQQQQQPQRAFKTLEEVEAELRAQRAAVPQQPQQQGQQKTLEEVEAEMLRSRQAAQPPQAQPQPQLPPGISPALAAQQLPPGMSPSLAPAGLPQGMPVPPMGFPALPPQFAAAFGIPPNYPPHLLPHGMRAQLHAFLSQAGGGAGAFPPGGLPAGAGSPAHSRQGSLAAQQGPPSAAPSPAMQHQRQQTPVQGGGFPQPPSGPPTPGSAFPPLGAAGPVVPQAPRGQELMATLFPPLGAVPPPPQQQGPPTVQSVEQQLQHLSMHGHTQHPSLTGAQLQSLLQMAQFQAATASASVAGAAAEGGEVSEEEREKKRAAEELIRKVEERILEHERQEEKRRRKAQKIAAMAKHNNLMSNSDKDFITRIQVSQLVTDDPYADDFYFHIMAAIRSSRGAPLPGAGGPPPPPGVPQGPQQQQQQQQGANGNGRRNRGRENAMNRMAQNVQRLVDSAKKRNERGGGVGSTLSLDGALGKIATRTRSAPRPLLQVKPSSSSVPSATPSGSSTAVPMTTSSSGGAGAGASTAQGPSTGQSLLKGAGLITNTSSPSSPSLAATSAGVPLSYRATLAIVEKIYDCVLDLEQLRRIQPQLHATVAGLKSQVEQMTVEGEVKAQVEARVTEAEQAVREGEEKEAALRDRLWSELRVMEALDACTPHPFVSILSVTKGKRILPRAIRHLSPEQTLTLLTLLVATFDTLDVVRESSVLDVLPSSSAGAAAARKQVEDKTEALLAAVVPPVMAVVGQAPLRMVTGMLGLLMDRNDLGAIVRSKPGLAFLTILLSRAEGIKQAAAANPPTEPEQVQQHEQDLQQWTRTFSHLFAVLSTPSPLFPGMAAPLLALFPSTRLLASLPFGFLAASPSALLGASALRPGQEADNDDEPVWRFLASVAVCAGPEQQQGLVMGVRDKVVENVRAARAVEGGKVKGVGMEVAAAKIRNVNLLLHALSLDASMIETDD
ncbi:hypothetical protein JCM10213_004723 [Rhodosporidiobolus nylandii]